MSNNKVTSAKAITMKDGTIVPAKSPVEFIANNPKLCTVFSATNYQWYTVKITSAFKQPTNASLEKWVDDCIAKSVSGKKVETDGWASDGSPSWLLALGLI